MLWGRRVNRSGAKRVRRVYRRRDLLKNTGAIVAPPKWFQDAVAAPCERRRVNVDGCSIQYLRWGDPAKPGIVLVHGGAAHAHWWSFLAPQLTGSYHVVAPDLSGHGDSE